MRVKPDIEEMIAAAEDELIRTFQRLVPAYPQSTYQKCKCSSDCGLRQSAWS